MQSFMEELTNRKFDLSEEVLAIDKLLNETPDFVSSLFKVLSSHFRQWKHRKNFISLDTLFEKFNIYTIVTYAQDHLVNLDNYIYYAESIINILSIVDKDELNSINYANWSTILENIKNTTSQLNYKIKYFETDEYYKIVVKDWKVSESAEIIQDTYNLGEKIYLYNHHSLKGQLFEKADILCRLYKVFESGKEAILKSNQFTTLASDIGFLSDKLDVRHAPDKKQKILLEGLTKEEQEAWYDDLFNLYLDMIILCEHIEKRKDIKALSKKLASIKP